MENKEAIKYLIVPVATSTKPSAEYLKQKEAYDLAIEALEKPQVTVFAENASNEEIENFKQELENVLERPHCWTPCPNKEERPQGDCENCDFRKFSEKFVDIFVDLMTKNDITSVEQLSEILKGVENMRKPNCITCDHFGKCEGCEKRDEE
jgi:hypothetical protein